MPDALAPRWHTAALVALIVGVATTGTLLMRHGDPAPTLDHSNRIVSTYLPMLVVQWGLLVYVCRVGRSTNAFSALLGERWTTAERAFADVAVAAVLVFVIEASAIALRGTHTSVATFLPHTCAERLTWAAVAVSVGLCEEIVYRGYLQTQLSAFTRSRATGIALQGALFGIAHADQGGRSVVLFGLWGALFGWVAARREGLAAGIVAHSVIDLVPAFGR